MASVEKRTRQDGTSTYRVKVRRKGQPAQTATFTRLTDAKKWAHQAEAAALEGRHFKTSEAKRHTLKEAVDRYMREVLPHKRPKTVVLQSSQLQMWSGILGTRSLADVTPSLLAEARDNLLQDGRTGPTVNRYLVALSHVFTIAEKEWGWMETNPLRKVRKFKDAPGRLRYLSVDEMSRLLARCKASPNRFLYPVVLIALSTGMRKEEIMGLTWNRVDLNAGRITLEHQHTKNRERRVLPLQGDAKAAVLDLSRLRRLDTVLLFPSYDRPSQPVNLRHPWQKALEAAAITDFRFHDLRHTAASYLAMTGADLLAISAILGHKTLAMVKRYAHLSDKYKAEALDKLSATIAAAARQT
jgi:integrase